MFRKSLIKFILSLIVMFSLVLTTVTMFPGVVLAQDTSNTALEALKEGIEFYEQGDLVNAESSYQKAIERVLENQQVEVLIAAKQRLAKIKDTQENIREANRLYEESLAGMELLGSTHEIKSLLCDRNCPTCRNERCRQQGSGPLTTCQPCGLPPA